jgi:hypothetical protein
MDHGRFDKRTWRWRVLDSGNTINCIVEWLCWFATNC